jgi:hypothetical protein
MFVIHKQYSRDALRIWNEQIGKGEQEGDNDAYIAAYKRIRNEMLNNEYKDNGKKSALRGGSRDNMTILEKSSALIDDHDEDKHDGIVYLIEDDVDKKHPMRTNSLSRRIKPGYSNDNRYERFLHLEKSREYCMNHIPKVRCQRYGRGVVSVIIICHIIQYDGDLPNNF